ncbi:MAG: FKBP-type peptidyl-prolyl cis-trans isomerase [Ilumatobacteraceae bacterium]
MRRTLPVLFTAALLLAACGSDGDASDSSDTTDAVDATTVDSVEPSDDSTAPDSTDADAGESNKPTVEIPDEIPTELVVTVLEPGSGPESEPGDTVLVDYVGVRSTDGIEFDNSYDRGEPFPVVLGTGSVIQGWDDGLVDVQAGARIQLDIPSDLAYGEEARSDLIGANEALTFVIDVRAILPPVDLDDQPTETGVDPSEGATELTTVDLREGDGAELQPGQTALLRYVLFRGDNGVVLESSWEGDFVPFVVTDDAFPVLVEGLDGMKVGGRRAITFPPQYPDFGFGPEGNPTGGLPAATDAVIVVDLFAVYGEPD